MFVLQIRVHPHWSRITEIRCGFQNTILCCTCFCFLVGRGVARFRLHYAAFDSVLRRSIDFPSSFPTTKHKSTAFPLEFGPSVPRRVLPKDIYFLPHWSFSGPEEHGRIRELKMHYPLTGKDCGRCKLLGRLSLERVL